jgi:phytoene synthase
MDRLESGFREARQITKIYAKTFYLASRFLSKAKRQAAYAVYAICRISDESVDDLKNSAGLQALAGIKENIEAAFGAGDLDKNLLLAFRKTVNDYKIPKKYFDELVEGMSMDLQETRYHNFQELENYCYRAAGVVGLIMLKIFGYEDRRAEKHAVDLGIAMQLTNILRDIKEDFQRGRIYLPLEELQRFGVLENDISGAKTGENFKELIKFQINRARRYYAESESGIKLINDSSCRRVVRIMKELYSEILSKIEKNDCDVYSQRASVNNLERIGIVLKILLGGKS